MIMRHRYRIGPDRNQVHLPFKADDPFSTWAKLFFKKKRLNAFIPYTEALNSFRSVSPGAVTSLQFKRALTSWCARKGYVLDPAEHQNKGGRIIRKHEASLGKWVATEMLFIKT